jgi:hypothetical protein
VDVSPHLGPFHPGPVYPSGCAVSDGAAYASDHGEFGCGRVYRRGHRRYSPWFAGRGGNSRGRGAGRRLPVAQNLGARRFPGTPDTVSAVSRMARGLQRHHRAGPRAAGRQKGEMLSCDTVPASWRSAGVYGCRGRATNLPAGQCLAIRDRDGNKVRRTLTRGSFRGFAAAGRRDVHAQLQRIGPDRRGGWSEARPAGGTLPPAGCRHFGREGSNYPRVRR